MMVPSGTLGSVIRARRCELRLTQEELADRIGGGMRQSEISRLERDGVMLPRRARLEAIAAALHMPVGELLARSGWTGAETVIAPVAATDTRAKSSSPASVESARYSAPSRTAPAPAAAVGEVFDRLHDARAKAQQIIQTYHDLETRTAGTMESAERAVRGTGARAA
jgi:transcriptional regulator with XRE-family HTH domain